MRTRRTLRRSRIHTKPPSEPFGAQWPREVREVADPGDCQCGHGASRRLAVRRSKRWMLAQFVAFGRRQTVEVVARGRGVEGRSPGVSIIVDPSGYVGEAVAIRVVVAAR